MLANTHIRRLYVFMCLFISVSLDSTQKIVVLGLWLCEYQFHPLFSIYYFPSLDQLLECGWRMGWVSWAWSEPKILENWNPLLLLHNFTVFKSGRLSPQKYVVALVRLIEPIIDLMTSYARYEFAWLGCVGPILGDLNFCFSFVPKMGIKTFLIIL